jgi:DNA-binding CsgD family transcriptional regulator
MRARTGDPISVVEACYDLRSSEDIWLLRLSEGVLPLMRADTVIAYHIDFDETGMHLSHPVQAGRGEGDVAGIIAGLSASLDRVRDGTATDEDAQRASGFEAQVNSHLPQPVEDLLLSELALPQGRKSVTLGLDLADLHFSLNHHIDGHGATCIVGRLQQLGHLRPAERTMWLRLGAHVKAGLRLRRRLSAQLGTSVAAPVDGAVLDPLGHIVHAEGEASDKDARHTLGLLTRNIDRARTASAGRDAEALAVWEGLVDGRWSLVEQFDSDGRRFMLAHKNPEAVVDPRGLTDLESRIARLAARGYSDKLVAYHLGIAEGTVSSQLTRAVRKLGLSGRGELVRLFGQAAPPSRRDHEESNT